MKSFVCVSIQYNPSYHPHFHFILLNRRLQIVLCAAFLPRRKPEAWAICSHCGYDPALEEGAFCDAEMLLNGLNC